MLQIQNTCPQVNFPALGRAGGLGASTPIQEDASATVGDIFHRTETPDGLDLAKGLRASKGWDCDPGMSVGSRNQWDCDPGFSVSAPKNGLEQKLHEDPGFSVPSQPCIPDFVSRKLLQQCSRESLCGEGMLA